MLKLLVTIYSGFEAVKEELDIEQEFKDLLEKNERLKDEWINFSYVKNQNERIEDKNKIIFKL